MAPTGIDPALPTDAWTSSKGRCTHQFFQQTCANFTRNIVNTFDGSTIPITNYADDGETRPWDQRCENAKETICVSLGREWIPPGDLNGKCYEKCLVDTTPCGPDSPNQKSCGRCCNKTTPGSAMMAGIWQCGNAVGPFAPGCIFVYNSGTNTWSITHQPSMACP